LTETRSLIVAAGRSSRAGLPIRRPYALCRESRSDFTSFRAWSSVFIRSSCATILASRQCPREARSRPYAARRRRRTLHFSKGTDVRYAFAKTFRANGGRRAGFLDVIGHLVAADAKLSDFRFAKEIETGRSIVCSNWLCITARVPGPALDVLLTPKPRSQTSLATRRCESYYTLWGCRTNG
jgi:hypothetical protein